MRKNQNERYFKYFEDIADQAKRAAEILGDEELSIEEIVERIKKCEGYGDSIERYVLDLLNLHTDPPLKGRSSIKGLVRNIDNILDQLKKAAKRMQLAKLNPNEFGKQITLIQEATSIISQTIPHFRNLRKNKNAEITIQVSNKELGSIERKGDSIYDTELELLEEKKDSASTMREWNQWDRREQIVEMLENAINQCEDVGSFMESLKLENV